MFAAVPSRLDFTQLEENVLRFWKNERIFEKTLHERKGQPEYVFYEGPPTANGKPGVHHVLARAIKDMFPRYRVMRGYHVVRRGGWDTHGLPVEIEVERMLGFTSKAQIEEYGIERFNQLCRRSVFAYIQDWERLTERIGYWVDLQDAYVTYTNDYIESVWWILKQLWEKGLLYQGYKVVPYCPRCGTPISDHEVAQGYAEAEDPSIYVRLPLVDDPSTSLLIWTTTPWTLPANVAVAAHPDVEYVIVERALPDTPTGASGGMERLILARALLPHVFGDEPVKIFESFKGRKLKGLRYQPLFTFLPPDKPAHYVVNEDFVTTTDGTGLVHLAPAFGADDMAAAQKHNLPILQTVQPDGAFIHEVGPWRGRFVKDADPHIIEDLAARGLLLKSGSLVHTYPFCWRCDTPLLYYARSTWYLRTTALKDKLVALNERINWIPEHIKRGRFGNWLENNVDWALGRERYWGTPLPVWVCDECQQQVAVGSLAELAQLAGRDLEGLDLHRPHVDEITFPCGHCQGTMKRVPELIDVWFDSGAMPTAQWHYPFEHEEEFQQRFPADFISEAVDQTRGWFYSLHAISTMLFGQECFKNVICLGLVLDENGQKMSKTRGNVIDPWSVIQKYGADTFRWHLYTATAPNQERRFSPAQVGEVERNFTNTLWNVLGFFSTYANLDGWDPGAGARFLPVLRQAHFTPLDRWLLSRLHALVRDVTAAYEAYDVNGATRPIQAFVEDLSNWYVRRSRRRFWTADDPQDKQAAYAALYETLVTLSKLLAPAMPFLAEELYQRLVRSVDSTTAESVHLSEWPLWEGGMIDDELNRQMALVMRLASLGHAARSKAGLKVRQPLSEAAFAVGSAADAGVIQKYAGLLADELNVRSVRALGSAGEAVSYTLKPLAKQLGQKYQALFPSVSVALLALDPDEAAPRLLAGEPLEIGIAGVHYQILPEEVEVVAQPHVGLAVANEGALLAALDTRLSEDLAQEGLAREFIRRVQELRKQSGFEISDRIRLAYQATAALARAIKAYQETIMSETLALELAPVSPGVELHAPEPTEPDQAFLQVSFDGQELSLAMEKVPESDRA